MKKKWQNRSALLIALVGSIFSTKALTLPLVNVEIQPVLQVEKCLKAEQQSCYQVDIHSVKTNIDWINQYFDNTIRNQLKLDEVALIPESESAEKYQQNLSLTQLKQNYLEGLSALMQQEFAPIGYFQLYHPRFFAQNGALAMFVEDFYLFSGGAHGYGSTNYLNFDLNQRKILTVDDLLLPHQKTALLEKLHQAYLKYLSEKYTDSSPAELEREYSLDITNNFTFTTDSLVFSYPPYVLGTYADGTITLAIPYTELVGILKPEYLFNTTRINSKFL